MHFNSFAEVLHMGGYGPYVWFCFIFTFALLIGLYVQSVRKTRQIHQDIRESATREQRIKQAKEADLL